MSKRSRRESSYGDERESSTEFGTSRRRRRRAQAQRQQRLYLLLDDWERGYSVHRVDEGDFDSDSDDDDTLPAAAESPLVRLEAQHGFSWSLVAHGTKIMAMHPAESSPGIPAFDTETLGVTVCPSPPSRGFIRRSRPLYVSAGGRLLAFADKIADVLGAEPPPAEGSWSWAAVEPPPPFASGLVTCYAVHPDGRTVFVSVDNWRPGVRGSVPSYIYPETSRKSTFTFDMVSLEWAHAGEWLLPFQGRADYDRELDAWVGLCHYEGGAGRVCCCVVPTPPAAGCETTMPAWKLGRDVFFDDRLGRDDNFFADKPSVQHMGATLVYKGDSGFFLVENRSRRSSTNPRARIRVLKITSFVLKYDRDGDLRTTHRRAYASIEYRLAHEIVDQVQDPVAFWM